MKRTHRKVRTGCLTCRRRRVRCDELRPECLPCRRHRRFDPSIQCQYPADAESPTNSDATQSTSVSASTAQDIRAISVAATSPRPGPTMSPDVTINDKFLLDHVAKICVDLEGFGGHLWTCGGSILVEAYHRSADFEFVRHSLCALAASHLSLLSKSISMVSWEYHHRVRAIQGLLSCLQHICNDQIAVEQKVAAVDAILITSLTLSWCAVESREYTQFMKGLLSTLDKAKHDSLSSSVISTFQPIPSGLVRSGPVPAPANENEVLSEAMAALTGLQKAVKPDKELDRAASELRNYVQNARRSSHIEMEDSQFVALFPIRNWLYWMPHAPYRLADRDPGTMLVLAHYEMVKIAMESLCPTIDTPLAVNKRADCLELLCQRLVSDHGSAAHPLVGQQVSHSTTSAQTAREYADLIHVPEQYIRLYRAKHGR